MIDRLLESYKWKDRYDIGYCHLCLTHFIECPDCHNISCNGGGCEKCHDDSIEFCKLKTDARDYLTAEQVEILDLAHDLNKAIQRSLYQGDKEVNFQKLHEDGYTSQNTDNLFRKYGYLK